MRTEETTPPAVALEELEPLEAPGWGAAFWSGAGFGLATGVLIWT